MNRKLKRVTGWIGKGLGGLLGLVALLVGVALLALQTPWAQRHIAKIASEQADKALKGRVEVSVDGTLSLVGLSGVSARVLSADVNDDAPLAELDNVRVGWNLWALVRSLLGSGPLVVSVDYVEVEGLFVDLRASADGGLALLEAVTPEATEAPEPETSGPLPYVEVAALELFNTRVVLPASEGSADGQLEVAQPIATIDRLHATFDMRNGMFGVVTLSSIEAPIPGQPGVLLADLSASGYMDESNVAVANLVVEGELSGVPLEIAGSYYDERWVAEVRADGSAHAWKAATGDFAPTQPVAATIDAVGDLEAAEVQATVRAAASSVQTLAEVNFSPLAANGVLFVNDANPRTFATEAPPGTINVTAEFRARTEPLSAEARLAVRESTLEGNAIPDFDVGAEVSPERADFQLNATDDSGLRLAGHVITRPETLRFEVTGEAKRLPEYPGAPELAAFEVRDMTLDARGVFDRRAQTLQASLRAYLDRFSVPAAKVQVADLSAEVTTRGPLDAPELDANIVAHAVTTGEITASHLRLRAASPRPGASQIEATTRLRLTKDAKPRDVLLRTTLSAYSPLTADGTLLTVSDDVRALSASVRQIRASDVVNVEGIRLSGVGELSGHARLRGSTADVELATTALDLGAVSELFAPLVPKLSGAVTANVGLNATGTKLNSAYLFTRESKLGTEFGSADQIDASLVVKKDVLSGTISVKHGESQLRVDARDVELGRWIRAANANSASAFHARDFRGHVVTTVHARSRDFREVERSLGEIHTAGTLQSQIIVEQRDDLPLRLSTVVRLRDVDVRKVEPPVPVRQSRPVDKPADAASNPQEPGWAITDLTADWDSTYDGATGEWVTSFAASERDRDVPIARVFLKTQLALAKLDGDLATSVSDVPLEGSVVVPKVALESLPGASFLPTGIRAALEADISIRGTVADPSIQGRVQAEDLRVSAANDAFPVSIAVDLEASRRAVDAAFELTHDTLPLANGSVSGEPERNLWRAKAKIENVPLGRLPYVRDYGVTGSLSGDVEFDSNPTAPTVTAQIDGKGIRAYGETIPKLTATAKLADGEGRLNVEIQQRTGRALLTAAAASPSGDLGAYRPTKVRLETRSFQIRPLLLALQGTVSDLSGHLDGAVEVAFDGGSTRATGKLELRDGTLLIPALGKRVHDIGLTLRAAPGKLELSRLDAKVERGAVEGDGRLAYAQSGELVAELSLRLPKNKRLPIANKGRNVAEASGRIDVKATAGPNAEAKINVDVPELDVYFSDSATDTVMSSETPAFVSMGTYLRDGHYIRYAAHNQAEASSSTNGSKRPPAKPTRITVSLGKNVWLHHGTSTFAGISGKMMAEIGETTRLFGRLDLAEGRIDIQGRVFDIRPGTVVFNGENPPNPNVVAEAAWTSPAGYTVIATYRGSVTNGKVVLRSEPPLSYGEILNVLLFDDPEGSGSSEGSPGAGDVAATVASAGLSKSLTSLTDLDVQASMDTDAAGSPRPELGVRLSPRLAVQVAYVLEASAALAQPPDRAFVSFDWRLSNAWSLETTLGDHGSAAADVTWKYRY